MFFSIFSSGGHLHSGTVLAILVKDDKRNIFMKLNLNQVTGRGGDII